MHGGLGAQARLGGMAGVRVANGRLGAGGAPGGGTGGAVLWGRLVSSRLWSKHTVRETDWESKRKGVKTDAILPNTLSLPARWGCVRRHCLSSDRC